MIILDTNVISEALKATADPAVVAWLDRQRIDTLYLTTMSLAELWTGLELLPLGQRRSALEARVAMALDRFSPARVLSFDGIAARAYATMVARARQAGVAIPVADGVIAAIAMVKGFAVATRDTGPFEAAGVAVVDPWR